MGLLRAFETVLCIRSGDMDTLHRYCRVPYHRMRFVPFPANDALLEIAAEEIEGYLYSSGYAHRDWGTLISALEQIEPPGFSALISAAVPLTLPSELADKVHLLAHQSPSAAHDYVRRARLIVIRVSQPCFRTVRSSCSMPWLSGSPSSRASTAGAVDYIHDGVNGVLVPPKDSVALARAIGEVMDDEATRARLSAAARRSCCEEFTADRFATAVLDEIARLGVVIR